MKHKVENEVGLEMVLELHSFIHIVRECYSINDLKSLSVFYEPTHFKFYDSLS